ncbi:MAG: T9SS type A sorting domain-containing protein, partial [Bacteroidales bacterium]
TAAYLYISMYNPDDALENQVQVNFTTPNQQWLTEAYPDEATTGWYTRVIDLTAFVGDTLNWMWLAPTAGQARLSYMDNIYMAGEPETTSIIKLYLDNGDVYYSNGALRFKEFHLNNAEVTIFDVDGRTLQKERADGNELNIYPSISNGIYIIRVVENNQLKMLKKLFIYK